MMKPNVRFAGPLTPMVLRLLIINIAIFIVQNFFHFFFNSGVFEQVFALSYIGLVHEFKLWQLFTYMFLHGSLLHLLFNMLALWVFAGDLENLWGSKVFLKYYLYCGTGAGLFIAAMNFYAYSQGISALSITLGASGAIYGILLAYGMTWPNRTVMLYFVFPIKIKYLVLIFGLIEFMGTFSAQQGGISHIGHLGGLISGFILMKFVVPNKPRTSIKSETSSATFSNVKNKITQPFGSFFKKRRLQKKRHEIETRIKAKKIIDDLLEKIARQGMSALTPQERQDLEWARQHYYPEETETRH